VRRRKRRLRRSDLVGRWRLASYTAGDRHPLGPDAIGVLQYSDDGKVSVHIMGEGYFAYYGDYSVDEARSTVTHRLEMCSDAALVGAANLRHASLDGRRLLLTGSQQFEGTTREIRVLWERDAD
jgi:hypothetical protein